MTGSFRGFQFVLWPLWSEQPAGVGVEREGENSGRGKISTACVTLGICRWEFGRLVCLKLWGVADE